MTATQWWKTPDWSRLASEGSYENDHQYWREEGVPMSAIRTFWLECVSALRTPTQKQVDSYGKLLHTLAAASLVGCVTVTWTTSGPWSLYNVGQVAGLLLAAVIAFFLGAILLKGD
jgi:hypothetical protein